MLHQHRQLQRRRVLVQAALTATLTHRLQIQHHRQSPECHRCHKRLNALQACKSNRKIRLYPCNYIEFVCSVPSVARQNSTSGNGTSGNGSGVSTGVAQKYVIVTPQSGSQGGTSTGVVKFQQPVVQVSFEGHSQAEQ